MLYRVTDSTTVCLKWLWFKFAYTYKILEKRGCTVALFFSLLFQRHDLLALCFPRRNSDGFKLRPFLSWRLFSVGICRSSSIAKSRQIPPLDDADGGGANVFKCRNPRTKLSQQNTRVDSNTVVFASYDPFGTAAQDLY